jgi:hypothetical protein
MTNSREILNGQILICSFARLKPVAFGLSLGAVSSAGLFLATAVLLLQGPQSEAHDVGSHLSLLGNYLKGYDVTWAGAVVGLLWGFLLGLILGWIFASLINFSQTFRLRLLERGFRRQGLLDG